jgi:Flp pilus assembly protein CpaB
VPRGALATADPAAFTLTVGAEHALGGALLAGDRISVLATFSTPSGGALTRVLARGLLVLAVGAPPSIGDPSEETVPVTVALPDPAVASALALANTVAHVDLLRDGAGSAAVPIPTASAPGVSA